jgi:hypothetical protein
MTDDTRPKNEGNEDSGNDGEGNEGQGNEGAGNEGQVGSLADEAARLFAAATDWARQYTADSGTGPAPSAPRSGDWPGHEHIATGAPECRWCPICQAISLLRTTTPDMKEHVGSLVVVARQILDSVAESVGEPGSASKPRPESKSDVEHIDLSEDDPWD